MSLNDIRLTDQLLQELYPKSLVLTEAKAPKSLPEEKPVSPGFTEAVPALSETKPASISFLGNNKRHFLILVSYSGSQHLPDEDFQFLGSILKACQLNAADVAIVNLARQKPSLEELVKQFSPAQVLDFSAGKPEDGLPGAKELTPVMTDQFSYLKAPSLGTLNQTDITAQTLKKQLWENLKLLLNL